LCDIEVIIKMSKKIGVIFGKLLRELRTKQKLARDLLSERSQIHVNSIYLLEKGDNEPKLSTIISLAEGLQMPTEELIRQLCQKLEADKARGGKEEVIIEEYY
jgi:transcriptional regulator with XRE-family HTH domain